MNSDHCEGVKCLMALSHRLMIVDDVPEGGLLFEWGSGGTSIWLARELRGKGARLHSIEHHPKWAEKMAEIKNRSKWNWTLREIPPAAGYAFPNACPEEENPALLHDYITKYEDVVALADVVLVDGVARGACLLFAAVRASRAKAIYIHDTQRDWYSRPLAQAEALGWKMSDYGYGPDEYPARIARLVRA